MKLESLGNIAQIIAGQSPPSSEYNKNGDGVPFFQGKADFGHTNPVARSWTTKTTKLSVPDDILISVRAPVGSVNINNIDACIGRGLSAIRVNKNISRDYVYQYLKVNEKRISKMGVGSTFTAINQKDLASIEIPIPENLADQIRIAEVLTKVETLIQQRKESIDLLDDFLRSTFLDMFGDPVKNEKKWNIKTIEQLVSKNKYSLKRGPFGGALKKDIFVKNGYLVYEQYHALNNDFSFERYFINDEKFNELKAFEVKPGDIIISCSGVYLGKLSVIPKNAKKGIINQALLKVTLNNDIISTDFFLSIFRHESFRNKFFGNTRGSGVPNFPPMSDFKKFKFIYPPIKLQNKFASIVEKAENVKEKYVDSLKELENLFGALSQKAFKGELDLSKLDVSPQIREIEKKIEAESGLDIRLETKLSKSMQQFIKQTADIQKKMNLASNMLPKSLLKQIESINRSSESFQKLNKIPEQLANSLKAFEGIQSIANKLNKEASQQLQEKLTWEEVNFSQVAQWISSTYKEYNFNIEMLLNFLVEEHVTFPNYYSSEELKTNPKLVESDDLKSFIFSALNNENQFIKLEQFFYDAIKENVPLKLREEDYEQIKDKEKELRSGIYFKVVE